MVKKKVLHLVTKILIELMFFGGILVCLLVPLIVQEVRPYNEVLDRIPIQMTVVLALSGIVSVFILWEARLIFKSLVNTNPFTQTNVNAIRKIAVSCFVISVIYIAKCLIWFTVATGIIVLIFAMAGLLCLVIADVFSQAVLYKEENDLTV